MFHNHSKQYLVTYYSGKTRPEFVLGLLYYTLHNSNEIERRHNDRNDTSSVS